MGAWILVIVAGILEVIMALSLKESQGFSRPWWTVSFVVFAIASFSLLAIGLKSLPVGSAYAVWTGVGAAGTALIGMVILGESRDAMRLVAIALIVSGVVLLQITGGGH
ncbi:MAG: multidrug efflux SMR transporter [Chloroflexota bacterium]|nr:multidrug efflux SMR transporter [Chloroflexota bacterium]